MTRPLPTMAKAFGRLALALALALAGASVAGAEAPPEPDGYRMGDYRAPTPETLEGATVVSPAEAKALWESGTVAFIDVLPRPPRPQDLPEDVVWNPPPRRDIRGSVWLANVGFGNLIPKIEAYFRGNLDQITLGRTDAPLLFYCKLNCWMSWNAAKRALSYGYTNVYWYPAGTDGWEGELEPKEPVPPAP